MQQRVQPVKPQRRAEKHREHLPPRDGGAQGFGVGRAGKQDFVHQGFAANGKGFRVGRAGKIHAAVPEPPLQFAQTQRGVRAGQVHFIDKNKRGYAVSDKQLPQGFGVRLHALAARNDQHGVVQHLHGAFRLGGKIDVTGGVQQGQGGFLGVGGGGQGQHRLLGKNGDAARAFLRVGVEKSVLVIHAPGFAQHPGVVEQPLSEGGFAAVNVCQQTDD